MLRRYKIGDVKKKKKERKINSILDINRLIKNILILNVKLYKRSKKTLDGGNMPESDFINSIVRMA